MLDDRRQLAGRLGLREPFAERLGVEPAELRRQPLDRRQPDRQAQADQHRHTGEQGQDEPGEDGMQRGDEGVQVLPAARHDQGDRPHAGFGGRRRHLEPSVGLLLLMPRREADLHETAGPSVGKPAVEQERLVERHALPRERAGPQRARALDHAAILAPDLEVLGVPGPPVEFGHGLPRAFQPRPRPSSCSGQGGQRARLGQQGFARTPAAAGGP